MLILTGYAIQRDHVRKEIERYKKLEAAYRLLQENLEKQYPEVIPFAALDELNRAAQEVSELNNSLIDEQISRVTASQNLQQRLPSGVEQMLKRGSKISIPRREGESSFLIWYSENGEYLVESVAYSQDPAEVYGKSWANLTIKDMLKSVGITQHID